MAEGLRGAFASGRGLGETKQTRREAAEIHEIKSLADPPKWATATLFSQLRERAKQEQTSGGLDSVLDSPSLVRSKLICRLQGASADGVGEPVGDWWLVLCKSNSPDEDCIVCLGQDLNGSE